ncbi:MAG: transposase [Candidatus Accumulibacter sp.]|uniref:transposase n=1 Tax=Accumulibacter sp. TaxID=2053492 RepID=UPI001A404DDB|nr:transposase [Accumulibacter sp.]
MGESGVSGSTASRRCSRLAVQSQPWNGASARSRQASHLAQDEATQDLIGIEVTTADRGDSEGFPGLLDQVEGDLSQASADGVYDSHGCHAAIAERDARACDPAPRQRRALGRRSAPRRHPQENRGQGTRRLEERKRLPSGAALPKT